MSAPPGPSFNSLNSGTSPLYDPQREGANVNSTTTTTVAEECREGLKNVLTAHRINYSVKERGSCYKTRGTKQVLTNVTGIFESGLNAILGPTGSGKTSFLNILADRTSSKGITGDILINGQPIPENFKCMAGYVVQEDTVMSTLTVRENVTFSASLRLPTSLGSVSKKERVENVIIDLGLTKCADTKVGNEFIRGISGGEKRRCSIGMELVISPNVLFLDEPTTGLDANTATTVLYMLKRLSEGGRVIIFSIHQPRYAIYRLFDTIMLLADGYTIYHGPSDQALTFFAQMGFVCEAYNNPPDFFLDVIFGTADKETSTQDDQKTNRIEKLVTGFKFSKWNDRLMIKVSEFTALHLSGTEQQAPVKFATGFCHQFVVLCGRAVKNTIRNPQTSVLTTIKSFIVSTLISMVFWQLSEDPKSVFHDRSGALFFLCMTQLFFNMAALEVFIAERKIFMHESGSGYYRIIAYFLAKIICDIVPLRLVPVAIISSICYSAIGLNPDLDNFLLFMLCLFCTAMACGSLAFLIGSNAITFSVGQLQLAMLYVVTVLFSGFFVRFETLGTYVSWIQHVSILKYALKALFINEFKDRLFCASADEAPQCHRSQANETLGIKPGSIQEGEAMRLIPSFKATTPCCLEGNSYLEQQNMSYTEPWDFWSNYLALAFFTSLMLFFTYLRLRLMNKNIQ